ncbi:MAG: TatD family deoxyribonuclease [Synergistales bacterium]|nr:TatD family deoxyribonuclease [Synergistales bacterium]
MSGLYIDSHCHLNPEHFPEGADPAIARAHEAGVSHLMVVGGNVVSSADAVRIARSHEHDGVYAVVGVHPHEASSVTSGLPEDLLAIARDKSVRAIGETGLDYYYDHSPREAQLSVLSMHLEWARKEKLPLVFHVRDAYDDMLAVLRNEGCGLTGVIHCFSGTRADADFFLEAGYYLSFAGPLTFARNETLRELFSELPSDRILLETDSPYLAPVPFRGKKNEPALVRIVYETAADVRGISLDEIARTVSANASRLFRWGDPYFGEEAER